MNTKSKKIYIWVFGNAFLLIRFLIDSFLIQCEPCAPNYPCPPCRTEFAKGIWIYFLVWNLLAGIIFILKSKKRN